MVAAVALKTPTAVAGWLVDRMAQIDAWLDESAKRLSELATKYTRDEMMRLDRFAADVERLALVRVERAKGYLDMCGEVLASSAERAIERQRAWLAMAEEVIEARSPKQILRLGFAVVRSGGKAILSAEGAKAGDRITIELSQGELKAEIVE